MFQKPAARELPSLALGVGLGGLLLWMLPIITTHQVPLVSDNGWDLYAIQEVARGFAPIRDFWCPYGPLGLYYGAAFFHLLGESVLAARVANLLLLVASAALAVRFARRRAGPLAALVVGLLVFQWGRPWYFFSHAPLIPTSLLALESAFRLAESRTARDARGTRRAFLALAASLALMVLTKPTVGIATSAGLAAGLGFAQLLEAWSRGSAWTALSPRSLAWPAAAGAVPVVLGALLFLPWVVGVPTDRLERCFPWSPGHFPNKHTILERLVAGPSFLLEGWRGRSGMPASAALAQVYMLPWAWLLALGLTAAVVARALRVRSPAREAALLFPVLGATAYEFLLLGSVHNFATGGLVPIALALGLLGLGERPSSSAPAFAPAPREANAADSRRGLALRWGAAAAILLLSLGWCRADRYVLTVDAVDLELPRAQVRVAPPRFAQVETAVTEFLDRNLGSEDEVLVLPHAPIFNFFSGRRCPLYSVHHVLPYRSPGEDEEYARVLLERPAPCVLVVNIGNPNTRFGVDFGRRLAAAIDRGYRLVGQIGGGTWEPRWGDELTAPEVAVLWRRDLAPPTWWPR
ncbi:MAG: hypothetical protein HYZ53_08655 [Planctomycetes bacterium]|nr:hypothetical protein [Planctomycetota bacterium]